MISASSALQAPVQVEHRVGGRRHRFQQRQPGGGAGVADQPGGVGEPQLGVVRVGHQCRVEPCVAVLDVAGEPLEGRQVGGGRGVAGRRRQRAMHCLAGGGDVELAVADDAEIDPGLGERRRQRGGAGEGGGGLGQRAERGFGEPAHVVRLREFRRAQCGAAGGAAGGGGLAERQQRGRQVERWRRVFRQQRRCLLESDAAASAGAAAGEQADAVVQQRLAVAGRQCDGALEQRESGLGFAEPDMAEAEQAQRGRVVWCACAEYVGSFAVPAVAIQIGRWVRHCGDRIRGNAVTLT